MHQNKAIDIVKFIACLFVVAIHINPMGIYGSDVCWLSICACRWAVPFFFVCTGYFFWKNNHGFLYTAKRLALLYLAWLMVSSFIVVPKFFIPFTLAGCLEFVRCLLFDNTFGASWFISATVEALGLVWLLRKLKNGYLLLTGCLLYILSLSYSIYYPLTSGLWIRDIIDGISQIILPTNSFIAAFIFIVIGKIVAEKDLLSQKGYMAHWVLLITSFGGGVIECLVMKDSTRWVQDAMICLPMFSYALVRILTQNRLKINLSGNMCKYLRNSSIIVYMSHYLFIKLVSLYHHSSDWKAYGFVVCCSLLLAIIIQGMSRYIKQLKYLY